MILPFLTASSWLITQITRCLSVYDSWLQPSDSQPPAYHEQARLDCDVKRRKSITVGRWKAYCRLSRESTSGRWQLFYIPPSALCFKRATRYTLLLSEPNIQRGRLPVSSLTMKLWRRKPSWHIPHVCVFLRRRSCIQILIKLTGPSISPMPRCVIFFNVIFVPLPLENNRTAISETLVWVSIIFSFGYFCLKC